MSRQNTVGTENSMRVVRFSSLKPIPWRNGGGTTRQILARYPEHGSPEFDWRISVADVEANGPFSAFAGIDRMLMLCQGAGMIVETDGQKHRLDRHDMLRFPGEQSTSAYLVDGPTVDLNVMTRRTRVAASMSTHALEQSIQLFPNPATALVIVVLEGSLEFEPRSPDSENLGPFDALYVDPPGSCRLKGRGMYARIDIGRSGPNATGLGD